MKNEFLFDEYLFLLVFFLSFCIVFFEILFYIVDNWGNINIKGIFIRAVFGFFVIGLLFFIQNYFAFFNSTSLETKSIDIVSENKMKLIKHSLLKELLEQEKFNMDNINLLAQNFLGVEKFNNDIEQSLFVAILKEKNNLKFLMSDLGAPYNYITLKNEWDTHTAGELGEYIGTEEQHNILNDKLLIFKNI